MPFVRRSEITVPLDPMAASADHTLALANLRTANAGP